MRYRALVLVAALAAACGSGEITMKMDAGDEDLPRPDAGIKLDVQRPDARASDQTSSDSQPPDGALPPDATPPDSKRHDAWKPDAPPPDTQPHDAWKLDALPPDASLPDQTSSDQSAQDGGTTCKHPAVAKSCKKDSLGMEWCTIPAGCFHMGSPKSDKCRNNNEANQIPVTLTHKFEIQATEVTQAQFYSLTGYKTSLFPKCGGTCPAEQVRWHDAAAYCNALSLKKGLSQCYSCTPTGVAKGTCKEKSTTTGKGIYACKGYRLPTEAEWEYAYRAGTTTALYNGANNQSLCSSISCAVKDPKAASVGWYCANAKVGYSGCVNLVTYDGYHHSGPKCAGPKPVGQKAANSWGLHDMAGNVSEWCHDLYQGNLGSSALTDPVGSGTTTRVWRGGSWYTLVSSLRAAARSFTFPTIAGHSYGFRCVRTLYP